jgi:hypothetical protein
MIELINLPHLITILIEFFQLLGLDESRATWSTVASLFYLIIIVITLAHCTVRFKKPFAPLTPQKIKQTFLGDLILIGIWTFSGYFFWCTLTKPSLNTFTDILINSALITGNIIFSCAQLIYNPRYERASRRYQDYYDNPQSWIKVGKVKVLKLYWQQFVNLFGNENYALRWFDSFLQGSPERSSDEILHILLDYIQHQTNAYSREDLVNQSGFLVKSEDWKLLLKRVKKNEGKALDWLRGVRCCYPGLKDMWVIMLAIDWIKDSPDSFDPRTFCQSPESREFDKFEFDD